MFGLRPEKEPLPVKFVVEILKKFNDRAFMIINVPLLCFFGDEDSRYVLQRQLDFLFQAANQSIAEPIEIPFLSFPT